MSNAPMRIGLLSDGLGRFVLATTDEIEVAIHYLRADALTWADVRDVPEVRALVEAARAVSARWRSVDWKAPATGNYINALDAVLRQIGEAP